jgi:transcription elongation factor GreA
VENGKISISSPLAKALLGKKIDDTVEVYSPGGAKEYEVENIKFV